MKKELKMIKEGMRIKNTNMDVYYLPIIMSIILALVIRNNILIRRIIKMLKDVIKELKEEGV